MKMDVDEKAKIVALWFGNQENIEENLLQDIEKEIEIYKQKKYRICIYQSGQDDIKTNLRNLILNNAY